GPGFLALKAIEDGIRYGRRGLGSIYVWASGNGGKDDDNCNCDGYTNSIYTISISSATQNGNVPWYSEACSSTLASTFSSGSYEERQIITTDLRKSCTEAHTGTSASAPLAAGIIALTLEANPELSWRDIQHIIVETSKPDNLSSSDWQLNGASRKVSHSFGYGMMNALAMVQMAKKWINVPNQRKCVIESSPNGHHQKPILIPKGDRLIIELFSSGCKGTNNEINYLEHVQAVVSVQSNSRGTLVVYLKSPMGTNSTLLDRRMLDQSAESFNKWPFTSVHMWGE
ncbi:Furin-like protease isoforms 1 1-X, partial [Brachionus plicatilis]